MILFGDVGFFRSWGGGNGKVACLVGVSRGSAQSAVFGLYLYFVFAKLFL